MKILHRLRQACGDLLSRKYACTARRVPQQIRAGLPSLASHQLIPQPVQAAPTAERQAAYVDNTHSIQKLVVSMHAEASLAARSTRSRQGRSTT
jgi:hypothetical protein